MALRFWGFFSCFFSVSSHLPVLVLVSIRGRRGLGGRLVQGGRVQAWDDMELGDMGPALGRGKEQA